MIHHDGIKNKNISRDVLTTPTTEVADVGRSSPTTYRMCESTYETSPKRSIISTDILGNLCPLTRVTITDGFSNDVHHAGKSCNHDLQKVL